MPDQGLKAIKGSIMAGNGYINVTSIVPEKAIEVV
jgi:hypothetical protein